MKKHIVIILFIIFLSSCTVEDFCELVPVEAPICTVESPSLVGSWSTDNRTVHFSENEIFIEFEDECYARFPQDNDPVIKLLGQYHSTDSSITIDRPRGFSGELPTHMQYTFQNGDLILNGVRYGRSDVPMPIMSNLVTYLAGHTWYIEGSEFVSQGFTYRYAFVYNTNSFTRVKQVYADGQWHVFDSIITQYWIQHPQEVNRPSILFSTRQEYLDNFGYVTKQGFEINDSGDVISVYNSSGVGSGYSNCQNYSEISYKLIKQ